VSAYSVCATVFSLRYSRTFSLLYLFSTFRPPPASYTFSLHDALPILRAGLFLYDRLGGRKILPATQVLDLTHGAVAAPWVRSSTDRKSTRLNSSHGSISYAVFCLKKKKMLVEELGEAIERSLRVRVNA